MARNNGTRTMYMHTLDHQPASYDDSRGPYIHFVYSGGGRDIVRLASLESVDLAGVPA